MTYQPPLALGGPRGESRPERARRGSPGTDLRSAGGSAGRLRGADVEVDAHKVAWVALTLILVSLLVLGIVFTLAGVRKNDQIQELRSHAVPIDVTVTSCVGLLWGSGTNFVGYSCTGAYDVAGRRYTSQLPGSEPHARGAVVHAVVVPNDPALISTAALVSTERTSGAVFIMPAVLFSIVVLAPVVLIGIRRRRMRRHAVSEEVVLADR